MPAMEETLIILPPPFSFITRATAWHTDGTFTDDPPSLGILHAKEVPSKGGGTLFVSMKAAYAALPGDGYYIDMPTMFHINFTDAPYWSPILSQVGMTGPIDGQRGFDIVNAYSVAFFDKELRGKPSPLLEGQTFPEAHIDIRRP